MILALAASDCERIRAGWFAQPANTVSSAAFAIAGCWLLSRARSSAAPAVVVRAAAAMIGVGLGSFAYHGPQPGWADPMHSWTVFALAIVLAVETIRLLAAGPVRGTVLAWKGAAAWMAAALVAYVMGRTGSSWCRPDTLWQPHAVWHVLSAAGLGRASLGLSRPARPPEPPERWRS